MIIFTSVRSAYVFRKFRLRCIAILRRSQNQYFQSSLFVGTEGVPRTSTLCTLLMMLTILDDLLRRPTYGHPFNTVLNVPRINSHQTHVGRQLFQFFFRPADRSRQEPTGADRSRQEPTGAVLSTTNLDLVLTKLAPLSGITQPITLLDYENVVQSCLRVMFVCLQMCSLATTEPSSPTDRRVAERHIRWR